MSEDCVQEGGAVTAETDASLRAVTSDLVTPSDMKDGKPGANCFQDFLQDDGQFAPLPVVEKEYLLDGKLIGNVHNDNNGSHTSTSTETSANLKTALPNHFASMHQNCTASENHNGARAKVPYHADSSTHNSGQTVQETERFNPTFKDSGQEATKKEQPDLVIEVGGQTINAHKSVLAEKSDYFKARLSRNILKVKGVSYKTMSTLIDYVYTAQMNVSKDNVVDVITGAKILQIPCAVQAAMDRMSEQITAENCYEILTIAKKQRLNELKETAYGFMSDNFLQILKDPSVYGRLTGSERDLVLRKRMEGRQALMVAEVNDVFDRVGSRPPSRCGSRPQSPLSVGSLEDNHMIYYYNEKVNDWTALTSMPDDLNTKGCGICTMYNYLFVAGGIKANGEKGKVSDRVFCYNPITNRWAEVRPLIQARAS
ncbi:hypothetical protein WMY93_017638 [Mugilogobius chulae]|uniref:BTB domain-containing protein n=1 Tax=Mugilogobius chulae TaxID=88201 RepID=A0AAW0NVY8_9GOBI